MLYIMTTREVQQPTVYLKLVQNNDAFVIEATLEESFHSLRAIERLNRRPRAVEPDGICPHRFSSILRAAGMI